MADGKAGAPLGNRNGRKAKIWEQALKRALARYAGSTVDAGLDRLADKMVKAAMEGDDAATVLIAEKIGDRLDGKPVQAIAGDDESPLEFIHRVELVALTHGNGSNSAT